MITLDGNHPLADQTLHFNVEVVGVREAPAKNSNTATCNGAADITTEPNGPSKPVSRTGMLTGPAVKGLGGEEASRQLLLCCLDASSPPGPCASPKLTLRDTRDI